ncbi:hypothetical protein QJS10_CPA06g01766 [Acorus calamus]|uniref:Uncharacterized protein n=1 Tax=Acorus calamus TaxID=4465 RepID=A0AAV9EL61_ACOCL|nr:hypothetical protein QJS10_CPA06g01766 [Acorus calamus]
MGGRRSGGGCGEADGRVEVEGKVALIAVAEIENIFDGVKRRPIINLVCLKKKTYSKNERNVD